MATVTETPFVIAPEATTNGLAVPMGDPSEIFKPGGSTTFVQAVREHVEAMKLDVSTKEGRNEVASVAYKIARTKTYAVSVAKGLSAPLKVRAKEIDAEADAMAKELDALKHETRRPLTEWENKDAERNADYEMKLGEIYNSCLFVGAATAQAIEARIAKLREYESIDWAEYSSRATQGFAECFPALQAMLAKAQQEEADRAELEELRKLKASLPKPVIVSTGNGEVIPARPTTITDLVIDVESEAMDDLCKILDIDQASDVLQAIKNGKIRHVQIVYQGASVHV